MQEVLAITLQAMHQDMQRLDRIGTNLANALTPGYKREVVASQSSQASASMFALAVDHMGASSADIQGTTQTFAPMIVQTDVRPGTLKSTGQSLDLALAGPGYFEVSTEHGPAYTRQGNFQVDARGRLVTAQGFPVMGKSGEIYLNSRTPAIDAAGFIADTPGVSFKPGNAPQSIVQTPAVAQIKVVQFEDEKSLQRLGDGLVAGSDNVIQLKDSDIQVRQGYLENSNVNSLQEMVQMMQTMRHFESMQKAATGYDDMTAMAIRKLGELS
jgi:flagellar basal-body rod protein FlgF